MSVRYEFLAAKNAGVELWDARDTFEETEEEIPADHLTLVLSGDEVTCVTGTRDDLLNLAARILGTITSA